MTEQDVDPLVARLERKRFRVHDLSGVGYEPDSDCLQAAALIRSQSERIAAQEKEISRLRKLLETSSDD